ncbi:helix-turn-helix domain-containing protein [Bacillus toyonensis]|uniref:helix-turn-helix domain-containing protein n=1 Tax=Bacillus toyonensis TaxID=155322 RepID=UPI000BF9AC78|nr:helix-turn-helix transcriptional regulator [Bacillus toyonensis]PGF05096.1 transcriptional regulator [Bacillus toyonensis]
MNKTDKDLRQDIKNAVSEQQFVNFQTLEIVGLLMAERVKRGLSQRELSKLSGVAQKTISRIESGEDIPSIETIVKLAKHLGYEVKVSVEKV